MLREVSADPFTETPRRLSLKSWSQIAKETLPSLLVTVDQCSHVRPVY
jgi:hypothetical protein